MIGELLPPPVETAEMFHDPPGQRLFPEEEALISGAVEKRRQEFRTVRTCAWAALRRLGIDPVPILPGQRGAPRWPDGVVGSMTHCAGYRAAAVARAAEVTAVGVDAEPNEPLPPGGVLGLVALPEERALLASHAADRPGVCWDRLLFSAKESVYKAWFPLTNRWLDFHDAMVRVDPCAGTFTARILLPAGTAPAGAGGQPSGFEGRWLVRDGLIVTAIAVLGVR
ncbi:MAG TPA: 4'-phosphopantetheinyl transferase superfamily protein [Streptomyces sp.]|uniref:4'-phosphopantetheinyl transferase family protein n=1 Tax=Streptomyces sp. TaxID=1931 RepID=UPI002D5A497C|nr:4'-phosphopantetheinyl transferase superfamily protein [Streptomyces sp.]HZG02671.1 4'-phosphopantetheinyl transferase superfamily protein [Streptomyces sp.]